MPPNGYERKNEQDEKTTNTSAEKPGKAYTTKYSVSPSAVDKVSLASNEQHLIMARAIDFLSDGSISIHATSKFSETHEDKPIFDCPLREKSIRIVLHNTKDVFSESQSESVHQVHFDNGRSLQECNECTSSSHPDPVSDGSEHHASNPSNVDRTSPSTSFHNGLVDKSHETARSESNDHDVTSSKSRSSHASAGTKDSASSRSSPGSEAKRHDWKLYQGGFSVDSVDVFRLWERDSHERSLPIGVNVMFDADKDASVHKENIWRSKVRDERHTITLNGDIRLFFTIPHLLRMCWANEINSLEVEARLFSTYENKATFNAEMSNSPLSNHLWETLRSHKAAMTLFTGDTTMGAHLLAFDVLNATITGWIDFLSLVRVKGAWNRRDFGDLNSLNQTRPTIGDREHIADFARCTRDLLHSMDACIKAIQIVEKFSDEQRKRFDYILLSRRTQHEALQNIMSDIEDYIDSMHARADRVTSEQQNASVERLTLVASIFLPLTMACSILSMSNRVNELGPLWWDWLGIVVITGLLVLVGYRSVSAWHNFKQQPRLLWAAQNWRSEWQRATAQVIEEQAELDKNSRGIAKRRKHLIPAFNRYMFRISKYLLVIGAVISFLIGMFVSVSIGAEALGFSVAGTSVMVVGSILIWRLLRLLMSGRSSTRWKKAIENQMFPKYGQTNPEEEDETKSQSETHLPGRILMIGLLIKLLAFLFAKRRFNPILWFRQVILWICTIFLGELVIKVASQMLLNLIDVINPDDESDRLKQRLNKRKEKDVNEDDIEASSGLGQSRDERIS